MFKTSSSVHNPTKNPHSVAPQTHRDVANRDPPPPLHELQMWGKAAPFPCCWHPPPPPPPRPRKCFSPLQRESSANVYHLHGAAWRRFSRHFPPTSRREGGGWLAEKEASRYIHSRRLLCVQYLYPRTVGHLQIGRARGFGRIVVVGFGHRRSLGRLSRDCSGRVGGTHAHSFGSNIRVEERCVQSIDSFYELCLVGKAFDGFRWFRNWRQLIFSIQN